jgi:hypothetical protein
MKQLIMHLDEPNALGRIYTTAAIQEMLSKPMPPIYGTIGVPDNINVGIDLNEVACVATDFFIEDGKFYANCTTLKTPKGNILAQMDGLVSYTSMGTGNIDENGVITNYTLTGIAVVPKRNAASNTTGGLWTRL